VKTYLGFVSAVLLCIGPAGVSRANPPLPPPAPYCPPQAPDACGPGYYAPNQWGAWYGPNYRLMSGSYPFNGARPPVGSGNRGAGPGGGPCAGCNPGFQVPQFPTHPYARSPRDYFMMDQ
jgi:hypothetical protein